MFSPHELLDIAIRIETNGRAFYLAAAETADNDECRNLLIHLADEEERHLLFFQDLKEKEAGGAAASAPSQTGDDEFQAYLHSFADHLVFTGNRSPRSAADLSMPELLVFAMTRETEAMLFYQDMKRSLPARHHALLDTVVSEERRHFSMLHGLLKTQTSA